MVAQRIVTRGLGTNQLLATRGYGVRRVIIELERRQRGGGTKVAKTKIAIEEEVCWEINAVLLAVNGDTSLVPLKGSDRKCFIGDPPIVHIESVTAEALRNADPVIVEAYIKEVRSRRRKS
jgi:hypothetical protein